VQIDLSWADRSREVSGPASALSAKVTLQGAAQDGTDFSFIVNRDAAPAGYTRTSTSANTAKLGVWTLVVDFYSATDASGTITATAQAEARLNAKGKLVKPDGTDLGTIRALGIVASVAITAGQHLVVGKTADLMVTVMDTSSNVLAISPGSISYVIDAGSDKVQIVNGSLKGVASGEATVRAVVDDRQSFPQIVTIAPDVSVRTLDLRTNDMVYDPLRSRIYASVPSNAVGSFGNSIVKVDPVSGAVESSVFVGNEPDKLAISDDGAFLYAGLDGLSAVQRIDLATFTPDFKFPIGTDTTFGPNFVGDIEVAPGNSHEVAVLRYTTGASPPGNRLMIFDDAMLRQNTVFQFQVSVSFIVFGADASHLYGYAGGAGGPFSRYRVDASGVALRDTFSDLVGGDIDLQFSAGKLYTNGGDVLDPETLQTAGRFNLGFPFSAIAMLPDVAGKHMFFVGVDAHGIARLKVYDTDTFRQISQLDTPVGPDASGFARSGRVIRWGTNGVAFNVKGDGIGPGNDLSKIVFISPIPVQ